jgi:hypothetical protein
MGKINKICKEQRLDRIMRLIADGYMTYQIVDICGKEWNIGRRAVERYLTIVYSFLKREMNSQDKDNILLEYNALIHKYEKAGDAKIALEYRKHRDKITGVANDININIDFKAKFGE